MKRSLPEGLLETCYQGSYWAYVHYEKIMREALLQYPQTPDVAIEVGCGIGMATYFLSKHVRHLISLDTDDECISITNRMVKALDLNNVTLKKTCLDRMSMDREVDLIFFEDVIHHMDSPVEYLRSCLPFSKTLLIVEANRYNPILYFLCKRMEQERLFLERNSLKNILSIVEKAGWRCVKRFYIESAAYPVGKCYSEYVFRDSKAFQRMIRLLDKAYSHPLVSSTIDRLESLAEKVFRPFCSEFIILA